MPAEVKRATRVSERLREELAVLLTLDVRDPRLAGVIVARVEMPDDLRGARVYVRLLEGGTEARKAEMMKGFAKAAGMLRREVTARLGLRHAPELRFYYDESQDKVARIAELLAEVSGEKLKE